MIKLLKNCCIVLMLLLFAQNSFAQIDSNKIKNQVVKEEMVAMQQQLNTFLMANSAENSNQSIINLNSIWQVKFDSLQAKFIAQQNEINQLKNRLLALETKKQATPEVVSKKFENVIGVLYFDLGSSILSEENKNIIKNIIKAHGDKTLQLVAYTDWTGNNETNQKLSDQRALSVQNELTNNGILIQNLRIYSKGKMAEENQNLSAKECRRVEIRW